MSAVTGWVGDFIARNRIKRFLVSRLIRYQRDIAGVYSRQKHLERASTDEILAYQRDKLRALLARARRSPYFGPIMDGLGVAPGGFELDHLKQLPFLTKEVLRDQARRLCPPGARGVYENYSGGSTGIPVRFWQDYDYKVHMSAATRRCNEMAGAFTGARVAKLWGAPQDKRQIEGPVGRTKLWLLNMRYYDTFDMGADRIEDYHRRMEKFQPDLIQAYASSIYLMASWLGQRGIRPSYPRLGIISAAERLFPHMRKLIEEVFAAPVFDRYGSREVSAIAAECEAHDGLHIQMPNYLVETIDPSTGRAVEEEPGEILITVLDNFAMPFLRYRIGDMGILARSRCGCGRSFYRLREVIGRTSDNFLMPDGRIVHGEYFTHLFYGLEGIERFQFVQQRRDEFVLRIVPAAGYSQELAGWIERKIREMIGESSRLAIEVSDQISKTGSGKYRFTISHLGMEEFVGSGREGWHAAAKPGFRL